jgi:hypothetical protein
VADAYVTPAGILLTRSILHLCPIIYVVDAGPSTTPPPLA